MRKFTFRLNRETAKRVDSFLHANGITLQGFAETRLAAVVELTRAYGVNVHEWPDGEVRSIYLRAVEEARASDAERRSRS